MPYPNPGQPKLGLLSRISNALPPGYAIRRTPPAHGTPMYRIYKDGLKEPVIERPEEEVGKWKRPEAVVRFLIKEWERHNA